MMFSYFGDRKNSIIKEGRKTQYKLKLDNKAKIDSLIINSKNLRKKFTYKKDFFEN